MLMDTTHETLAAATDAPKLEFDNLEDGEVGEVIHQRCIIIKGRYILPDTVSEAEAEAAFATVECTDSSGTTTFPTQTWPISSNRLKMIVLLSPGPNNLTITANFGRTTVRRTICLTYMPLLQTPPLHLAIMVAKNSPLLIDCPPSKHAGISSAHSSLDAAIAKVRMSAYMWQALTAEDMREKGLGRRSFRLEEEWSADTTSRTFLDGAYESDLSSSGAMRSTAKVHVIRSEKSVAEIRHVDVAQQNKNARSADSLFDYFREALSRHGAPFESSGRPIVAGLILDSHYSMEKDMILGHAALGCHQAKGLSLGMMGSHLTYAWPRFLEEVTSCLLDTRAPGATVGNDNGECGTFWEACSVGQGAFLHEVGHAFGAPHTTGIMARGYSGYWPRNFLSRTARSTAWNKEGVDVIDGETRNDARWDMRENLSFRLLPHFWLPGDVKLPEGTRSREPTIAPTDIASDNPSIIVSCPAGIASISFNGTARPSPTIAHPVDSVRYSVQDLEASFARDEPLKLSAMGMNGKSKTLRDAWRLFARAGFIRVPGTDLVLNRQSVQSDYLEEVKDFDLTVEKMWKWATLLVRKGPNGKVEYASGVDIRTGLVLDGAYVHFRDGTQINCGPRVSKYGGEHEFGGHAAEEIDIPKGQEIVKVEVAREGSEIRGMRMYLSNGTAWGALSGYDEEHDTTTLEPPRGERIIGFFGLSFWGEHFDQITEFGILTAPKDLELPDIIDGSDDGSDNGSDDDSEDE
ncbi:related to jacalin-like lectin domain-containing protein [Cephalotrichum gorgonifer]|uniref:Related to jacalin-like lectin domain-containing protein n=1 Tax=Cephalotrichum gorgonifer TaxID=2041049 RepID=A0AAE8SXG0_9PEZI|nr:related to jacalin-like lectin domain-containing protein [Cephalotrichum gorgonifer]